MARSKLPKARFWISEAQNRVPGIKNDFTGPKINSQIVKLPHTCPKSIPRGLRLHPERGKYSPSFCQSWRYKAQKIHNLIKIEKWHRIITTIFQKYGCKSPHSQYSKYAIYFTPRAKKIGSQRPKITSLSQKTTLRGLKMTLRDQSGHSHTFRCSSGETIKIDVKNTKKYEIRILFGILKTFKFLQKQKDAVVVKR